ncbi:MAG: hypothetical protein HYZ42_08935 [Bacteroidetes bacterium]|nr:hypothetical protein [Bacteroidota bacterium]
MKKNILLFLLILGSCPLFAQNLIAVNHNGSASFYPELDSAIIVAQKGDSVFIPSGNYYLGQTINKSIHIFGVGMNNRSYNGVGITQITSTLANSYIYIGRGADSGSIEGIATNGTVFFGRGTDTNTFDVNTFTFNRCYLYGGVYAGYYNASRTDKSKNVMVKECIVLGMSSYATNKNWFVANSIIESSCSFNFTTVSNCIFLYNGAGIYFNDCMVRNNIFYTNNISSTTKNNQFYNNVNTGGSGYDIYNNYGQGNFNMTYWDSNFVSAPLGSRANFFTNNYQLRNSHPGKNNGTDGTDIGIYGGEFPWKEGSLPVTPLIYDKFIQGSTDVNGNLPVKMKVKAQSR